MRPYMGLGRRRATNRLALRMTEPTRDTVCDPLVVLTGTLVGHETDFPVRAAVSEPFPLDDGPKVQTNETCPQCGRVGHVTVTPFIPNTVSTLLFWHCGFCEHAWVTDERRDKDRS
jgi:hypothetical protein